MDKLTKAQQRTLDMIKSGERLRRRWRTSTWKNASGAYVPCVDELIRKGVVTIYRMGDYDIARLADEQA